MKEIRNEVVIGDERIEVLNRYPELQIFQSTGYEIPDPCVPVRVLMNIDGVREDGYFVQLFSFKEDERFKRVISGIGEGAGKGRFS